jgi:hypothetical protein
LGKITPITWVLQIIFIFRRLQVQPLMSGADAFPHHTVILNTLLAGLDYADQSILILTLPSQTT